MLLVVTPDETHPTTKALGSALLTDLYQLTMLSGYHAHGMAETAVFEFFVRRLPAERRFLLAAGLEQAVEYLEDLRFEPDELRWLQQARGFSGDFIDYLAELRFSGDVDAMPEGTICFANEPLLRVVAPLPEAQLVESRLINILHLQTLIASKAARSVLAAPDKLLVDFGMRRAHGAEAALFAARASYLTGFSGTATVLAGKRFGIPNYGTMAHSFVQAHASEYEAFCDFAREQPKNVVLLIDTYDTEQGARAVVEAAKRLAHDGISVQAVRLDSGDLAALSHKVRAILDAGGLTDVHIFASGNLDEYGLETLLAQGAPIDGFGIGTNLDVSIDAPQLDCAYKLQEYAGRACRKRSTGKETLPGRKQVYRQHGQDGHMCKDILSLEDEAVPGQPLLEPVMRGGRRIQPSPGMEAIRRHVRQQLDSLPPALRALHTTDSYTVEVSSGLRDLVVQVDASVGVAD